MSGAGDSERSGGSGDESFDDVAARAAHELASPLNKVTAFAGLLREELDPGALSDEVETTIVHLCRATEEARAVVARFHEWARATRVGPATEVVLANGLDGAMASLGRPAIEAGILRDGAFAAGATETVRADGVALGRVLELLLENALAYVTPGTTPRVRVAAERTADSWRLLVDDAGLGVAPSEREHVFEPFVRLHGKSRYPGVGLGLSIVRRVVEARGGRVVLEDSPWGGVRARVDWPAR